MSRRTVGRFIGAIRLVPKVDTIGIPIFAAIKGNEMFVPEMDGDFRIMRFDEFFNEDGYQINYDVPAEFYNERFSVGAPTPLPFWLDNKCYVIQGDADKQEPAKLFGNAAALSNPVLADLSRLLDEARSGKITERMQEWTATNIANTLSDVFFETPIRSRYWVTRYRVAVAKARQMTQPPHPIDNKLRFVAGDWFKRFGNKTDLSTLCGMLGTSRSAIFSKRQITDIIFAFLVHKIAEGDFDDLERYTREPAIHPAFPGGLYGHYIEHGWPRVPFEYNKIDDLIGVAIDALADGHYRENYQRVAKLCFLLFGRSRVPSRVEDLAHTYLAEINKTFKSVRNEAKVVFAHRINASHWKPYAEALLDYYDQMMDLDGIINGSERMKRVPVNNRFGVPIAYINDLKKIRKGEWD